MKNLRTPLIITSTTGIALMAVLGFVFFKLYKDNQACFEKRLLASNAVSNMFHSPLSKEVGFQLEEELVIKWESSSQKNELAQIDSDTSSKVSHIVLFEDKKPVCVKDVVGRPELVPHFMEVKNQGNLKNSNINLPPCDDFQLSVLRNKARHALLINGKEPIQLAALVAAPIIIWCLASGTSGAGLNLLTTAEDNNKKKYSGAGMVAGSLLSLSWLPAMTTITLGAAYALVGICGVKYLEP